MKNGNYKLKHVKSDYGNPTKLDLIKGHWNTFWFKWHSPNHIRYGGGPQGYRTFRKQRLFNIITGIFLISIFILLLF